MRAIVESRGHMTAITYCDETMMAYRASRKNLLYLTMHTALRIFLW
jgi:hypothetical protein